MRKKTSGSYKPVLVEGWDPYTGSDLKWIKATTRKDGTAISDSDIDGVVYLKDTTTGEYYRRGADGNFHLGWWNVLADGSDNVSKIQAALDTIGNEGGGTLHIPDGDFVVTPTSSRQHCLFPKSNTNIVFSGKARLIVAGNDQTGYSAIRCNGVFNVNIFGANIVGDRDSHIGTTGESGMCISITNSFNLAIHGANLSKAWGDGIYVGGGAGIESANIFIDTVTIDNCRRNGISIVSCKGAKLNGITSSNHSGVTGTGSGIDLEPNAGTVVTNIALSNIECYGNAGSGIVSSATNVSGVNIHCHNNSQRGLYVAVEDPHEFTNVHLNNNGDHGLYLNAVSNFTAMNVYSYSNTGDGIRMTNCFHDVQLIGGGTYGNANGITVSGTSLSRYVISNLTARNNTGYGVTLGAPHGLLDACHVYGNGERGVILSGDYCTMTASCEVYENSTHGVQVSANYCRVLGSSIHSNSQAADNTHSNITLTLNASYCNIINNMVKVGTLTNKPKYGILINSSTNVSNVIVSNDLSGSGTTANIQDNGTSTIRQLDIPTLQQVLTGATGSNIATADATFAQLTATAGYRSRVASGGNWFQCQSDTGIALWIWQRSSGGSDWVLNRRDPTTGISIDNVMRGYSSTGNLRIGNNSTDPGVKLAIDGVLSINGSKKTTGTGSPEGVVTGNVGDEFNRTDGGVGTTKYIKESGSGNTGWRALAASTVNTIPLKDFYVDQGNTSTSPNTYTSLLSYDIPSSTINADGQKVIAEWSGSYAANTNGKGLTVFIAGTGVATITSSSNGGKWLVRVTIIRTSSSTARVMVQSGDTGVIYRYNLTGLSFTSAITLAIWGTSAAGAVNDVVGEMGNINWVAAAP